MSVVISLLLPFVSHVVRQSMACANVSFQPYVFTCFMMTYAISMGFHAYWMDAHTRRGILIILPFFLLTFVASVILHHVQPTYFVVTWCLHAFASAALWPVAYKYINSVKRSRLCLVIWSLQGSLGDAYGCVYKVFDSPYASSTMTLSIILGVLVALSFILLLHSRTIERDVPLIGVALQNPPRRVLCVTILASVCIKTITYTASNWMHSLHLQYLLYNVGNVIGTILSGIISDKSFTEYGLITTTTILLVIGITSYLYEALTQTWVVVLFGTTASCTSTLLSICICTDISDMDRKHGRTTAIIDGVSTFISAFTQLIAREYFVIVQLVSSACLCVLSLVFKLVIGQTLSHRVQ